MSCRETSSDYFFFFSLNHILIEWLITVLVSLFPCLWLTKLSFLLYDAEGLIHILLLWKYFLYLFMHFIKILFNTKLCFEALLSLQPWFINPFLFILLRNRSGCWKERRSLSYLMRCLYGINCVFSLKWRDRRDVDKIILTGLICAEIFLNKGI